MDAVNTNRGSPTALQIIKEKKMVIFSYHSQLLDSNYQEKNTSDKEKKKVPR